MGFRAVYSHLVFIVTSLSLEDSEDPIPNWPIKLPENLYDLSNTASDGSFHYFSNLTTGQFICLINTAKNFEIYNLKVTKGSSSFDKWIDIATVWLSHFTKTSLNAKAIWALFNRRQKNFKELQKCFNARNDPKVKEKLIRFLNDKLILPGEKKESFQNEITNATCTTDLDTSSTCANINVTYNDSVDYSRIVKRNKQLAKNLSKQSTILKSNSAKLNSIKMENNNLKTELSKKKKRLSGVDKDVISQINRLKKKSQDLSKKSKELKSLKLRSTHQQKQLMTMKKEIGHLSNVVSESLDLADEKENTTSEVQQKLYSVNKLLKSTKKKVQRRNRNISGLKSKLHEAYGKFETDTESMQLYYNGIVENLKNQNQLNSEMQKMKIEEMKNLETQSGGKYKGEVRLLYYDLLTKGVSANTIQSVVRTVLENMTEYDTTKLKLPSRSTAQRMVSEAGELVKIRTAYELSKEKTMLCHQSDGTTKNLIHWGAHAVKLLPNDDPNNPIFFTLTVSPVSSGKADDTVKQLQDQLEELSELANKLGLDNDENSFSISRIGARMSDRAANEKRVSKLIMEKKDNGNLYTFTCAAHKINNMASAMTDASANALYVIDKKMRGMHGAKKHIYECNKLLCEHARKEYGLGVDFKAYTLCNDQNSGSDLFRPIVGSRYLIFLQNAIPTLSAREIVLMYLEDIKDAKETPGLNRLEYSVQQGYLNTTTVTEEIAFALMYFYVCSPLMQKAKSTKSPLEMNGFYEMTIAKLQEWSVDPSGLINGDDLLWENAKGPQVYIPYMTEIHKMTSENSILIDTLKVMAKAGKDKLHDHAVEHLPGGEYAQPTQDMLNAARTVGEATNDRIESMFGMLDRQMKLAPSSNPVNVNSLISAKQDKPVQWLKTSKLSIQNVCEIAMTKASQKRKNEGTRIEQIKKRFLENKEERAQKIAKRRKIRQERKRRLDESLKEAKLHLCRKNKSVKNMNKTQLLKQVKLWRALAEVQHVNSNDVLKNFNKLSPTEQVLHLKTIIGANKQLVIQEWESSDEETLSNVKGAQKGLFQENDEWSSSDEETLDMACALVHL